MNTFSICTSCNHEENCIHIEHSIENILQCEEFEMSPNTGHSFVINEKKNLLEDFSGLCKNCSNRNNCMNRNSNTVIWHCEDYES